MTQMIARTFHGLEKILANELASLGAKDIEIRRRAVSFKGNQELSYRANLELRTALDILIPIATFEAEDENILYKKAIEIAWTDYISLDNTFAVKALVNSNHFRHSKYVALKTKDAIADYIRQKKGKRPNVDTKNPEISIIIHISGNQCTVSLNSSGMPLFKRGYRTKTEAAPINEVLAAGLILLSDWNQNTLFIDPMCGSGTIPIEACMIALNHPPNLFRSEYGFFHWPDFNESLWEKVKKEAEKNIRKYAPRIIASDQSSQAIRTTRKNIQNAGLQDYIRTRVCDIAELNPPEKGILIFNPPYGERMGKDSVLDLYKYIGDTLKQKFIGFEAYILSCNNEAIKKTGLRHTFSYHLNNGALSCKFRKYELYEGSKKK